MLSVKNRARVEVAVNLFKCFIPEGRVISLLWHK